MIMNKARFTVKTGDTVMIIRRQGAAARWARSCRSRPKEGKVIVENANFVQKHVKPRRMVSPAALSRPRAPSMPARCS